MGNQYAKYRFEPVHTDCYIAPECIYNIIQQLSKNITWLECNGHNQMTGFGLNEEIDPITFNYIAGHECEYRITGGVPTLYPGAIIGISFAGILWGIPLAFLVLVGIGFVLTCGGICCRDPR